MPASSATAPQHKGPLIIAASVSALGGLLFGYDNIVISGAIHYLALCFKLDAAGIGWAAGCALIGCTVGAAGAGSVVDRIGLKKGLALCAACFALSSAGMWFAASLNQFVIWRLIGGLGIGAASIIAPMYIAEIAPARLRGRLVTLYQLGIVLGILAAVFVNMVIQRICFACSGWCRRRKGAHWKTSPASGLRDSGVKRSAAVPAAVLRASRPQHPRRLRFDESREHHTERSRHKIRGGTPPSHPAGRRRYLAAGRIGKPSSFSSLLSCSID